MLFQIIPLGIKFQILNSCFLLEIFIDSMATKGKVVDAFSGKPVEGVTVMLYEDISDSIVSKSKPVYYSVTDKEGNYSMTYLKAGVYKLFALKDENRNFLYDLPNEFVGKPDSLISLYTDTIRSYKVISLFAKDYKKQGVKSKKYYYPGKLVMTFVKPAKEISINKLDSSQLQYNSIEINTNRDSIVIWQPNLDSGKNVLTVQIGHQQINCKYLSVSNSQKGNKYKNHF